MNVGERSPKPDRPISVTVVFGNRPEAIKMSPLIHVLKERATQFDLHVVVTSERPETLKQALTLFDIEPDLDLGIGNEKHDLGSMLAMATAALSKTLAEKQPDLVLVLGDTISTLSATLAAYYQQIPVAHVEAGLRAGRKYHAFPEEGHRMLVSCLADLHFAPTNQAKNNLLAEGIDPERVFVTGNTGVDAVLWMSDRVESMRENQQLKLSELFGRNSLGKVAASTLKAIRRIELGKGRLILITGSRPESFGRRVESICGALSRLTDEFSDDTFVYPVDLDPTIRETVHQVLGDRSNIHLLPPLDYLPFVYLMKLSYLVLTDSGSIQEEAPVLSKPALVMRSTTDRPEALQTGALRLVGTDSVGIVTAARRLLNSEADYKLMAEAPNPFGDGHAAERIADVLEQHARGTLLVKGEVC